MPSVRQGFDEMVARTAISRLTSEAEQVAAMRGLPADIRYATPEEELRLYYQADPNVNPQQAVQQQFAKHMSEGMTPDGALAEAILETSAILFPNKLKMGQTAHPTSLTQQVAYHNAMAAKYDRFLALTQQDAAAAGQQPLPHFQPPESGPPATMPATAPTPPTPASGGFPLPTPGGA